ncbi:class IV adenylate cyclase [Candidatus Nomurabacteria bacterium]|nr:class IV adenylate cyclase [Candidatus Nomurabacteria bacterium]
MKNIELKAKVNALNKLRERLVFLGVAEKSVLHQIDTYFQIKKGRLKLREINSKEFELIYYERPDVSESKVSTYEIISFDEVQAKKIKSVLGATNGLLVTVEKERELWIYKNTRIHLDDVTDLGEYVELETVVGDISMPEAQAEHYEVMGLLELDQCEKCDVSYSDLLLKKF